MQVYVNESPIDYIELEEIDVLENGDKVIACLFYNQAGKFVGDSTLTTSLEDYKSAILAELNFSERM